MPRAAKPIDSTRCNHPHPPRIRRLIQPSELIELSSFGLSGEPPRNRTENPQIKSLLLCQLS